MAQARFHDAVSSLSSVSPSEVDGHDDMDLKHPYKPEKHSSHHPIALDDEDDEDNDDDHDHDSNDDKDDDSNDGSTDDDDDKKVASDVHSGFDSDSDSWSSSASESETDTIVADNEIEADAAYVPDQGLLRAINDSKVLWLTYHPNPSLDPKARPGAFEIVPVQGTVCTQYACALQLHVIGHNRGNIEIDIEADSRGEWTATNVPRLPKDQRATTRAEDDDEDSNSDSDDYDSDIATGATASAGPKTVTKPSLHLLLNSIRRSGIIYSRAKPLPNIEHYIWLPSDDADEGVASVRRASRKEANDAVYAKYVAPAWNAAAHATLLKPTGNRFHIVPSPYKQPHMDVSTLRARSKTGRRAKGVREAYSTATFILGFHPRTKTWFLTDPHSPLVYVSKTVHALLTHGISEDIVVKIRKQRSDKGVARKVVDGHTHKHKGSHSGGGGRL